MHFSEKQEAAKFWKESDQTQFISNNRYLIDRITNLVDQLLTFGIDCVSLRFFSAITGIGSPAVRRWRVQHGYTHDKPADYHVNTLMTQKRKENDGARG